MSGKHEVMKAQSLHWYGRARFPMVPVLLAAVPLRLCSNCWGAPIGLSGVVLVATWQLFLYFFLWRPSNTALFIHAWREFQRPGSKLRWK